MPTLIENLNLINSYKSDIKSAIEDKGVDMTGVAFSGYASKIGEIQFLTDSLGVSQNGTYFASDEGLDGWTKVHVSVPGHVGEGTFNNPYTVGEANEIIEEAAPSDTAPMYVSGKIVSITSSYTQGGNYGNATFTIEDDYNNRITAYRLRYINNTKYNEVPAISTKIDVQVNDEVIIYGIFKKYQSQYQTKAGDAYLYLLNGTGLVPDPDAEMDITSPGGYNVAYWGSVLVNVSAPVPVTEVLSVSQNGTYYPGQGVDGFSQVDVNVPQSVTGITEKEYTEGRAVIVNLNNSASFVRTQGFYYNSTLQTVYLSNCTQVHVSAFANCSNLTTVNLPVCEYISSSAFENCSNLSSLDIPNCKSIRDYVFINCSSLTSLSLSKCTYIGAGAFYRCRNLSYIYLPVCTVISGVAYGTVMGTFEETIITSITLPVCSYIYANVFRYASNLNQIELGSTSVCTLGNKNAFAFTPIDSGTGSIYVPASLVDAYKSATNWSLYSSQIFPITV